MVDRPHTNLDFSVVGVSPLLIRSLASSTLVSTEVFPLTGPKLNLTTELFLFEQIQVTCVEKMGCHLHS